MKKLVSHFVFNILPRINREIRYWEHQAKQTLDLPLQEQALLSLRKKRFHAQGGCVYALRCPQWEPVLVPLIVAVQTISDYLDNLCDRTGVKDESAFRQLHLAMLDAVDPIRGINNYYYYYPYKNDGGYLEQLVNECRKQIKELPSYNLVIEHIKKYIHLYIDLQSYKHLSIHIREKCLKVWADYYTGRYPGLSWWEFSAASGSTLGVFVMLASAFDKSLTPEKAAALDHAYFPWICGLHILLDYYIDSQEDTQMGDLNFTSYYKNLKHCEERLTLFSENALKVCQNLQYGEFHLTVVKGLLAMYLSDPKACSNMNRFASKSLVKKAGGETTLYYHMCKMLRSVKTLA